MEVLPPRHNFDRVLSHEDCEEILSKNTKSPNLVEYSVTRISEHVLGFLGEHLLLTVTFQEDNGKTTNKVFFLKCLPQVNSNQKEYVEAMGIFTKEIRVYKNLISEFLKAATKQFAPEFYFYNNECIVLENMHLRNFSVAECCYLNVDRCRSVLKTVAIFHAASLIFEEKRSTDGKKYRIDRHFPAEIQESTFSFVKGHPRNKWLITTADCLMKLSKYFSKNANETSEKLRNYIFTVIPKLIQPSDKYRNVVSHDDLWCNNFMFDECNNCILVDFQLTRYTPPIFDVLLTLYINMERNILNETKANLLDHYYKCLENELEAHQLKVQKILPKEEFLKSAEDYTLPALIESALYGTNVFLPKELSSKIVSNMEMFEDFSFKNRTPYIVHEFEDNLEFKKRFSDVLIPLFAAFD